MRLSFEKIFPETGSSDYKIEDRRQLCRVESDAQAFRVQPVGTICVVGCLRALRFGLTWWRYDELLLIDVD